MSYFGNEDFGNEDFGNEDFGNEDFDNEDFGNEFKENEDFDNEDFGNEFKENEDFDNSDIDNSNSDIDNSNSDIDNSDSDIDNEDFSQIKYSVNVLERVGLGGISDKFLGINFNSGFDILSKQLEKLIQDPLEKFMIYVHAICRQLNSFDIEKISEEDIVFMLTKAKKIKKVQYKNPTAYILGYLSTNNQIVNKTKFKKVIKNIMPKAQQGSIYPEDVLRYARYWELVLF